MLQFNLRGSNKEFSVLSENKQCKNRAKGVGAGGFVLAAATAYTEDTPADEKAATLRATQRILGAATAGGFTQADIFETLLSRMEPSVRIGMLAVEAVNAAGMDTVAAILQEECAFLFRPKKST